MSGRDRRRVSAALALVVIAAVVACRESSATIQADLRAIPNQNVLLITIDTLRADALGSYGGPAATPALDRLAAEGVRFDFAHAHAVLTLPSHASILTGQYPFQHGVRDNSGYRLAPNARTIATLLKDAGYDTAAFVGAFPVHSRFGLHQGFDVYDDRFGETRAPTEFVMPERPATEVVQLARAWISLRGSRSPATGNQQPVRPWFMWVHVFDPHAPYRPPPPVDTQYARRPYYGEVAATDAALAPLLDDVRGASRPALVIVTGDHGEALGDHGEESHGLFAYESTLRIPLIIAELASTSSSRDTPTGELSHVAARHVDLLPTMLGGGGPMVPADVPGRALMSAGERRSNAPRTWYFEAMAGMLNRGWAPLSGVIVERGKCIDLPIAERYDLAADPDEKRNLSGQSPDRDRTLAAALREYHAPLPGQRRAETPEALAELRALGYVSGSAAAKTKYTEADDPKRLIDLDAAIHTAVEAFGARRIADAVQIYERVIARRPDMAIAYRHLAFVQWERGDVSAALKTLQRAVAAGVTETSVVTQLGEYLAETGEPGKAIEMLQPLAKDPNADADTLNALGIALARGGRRDEARRVFVRVLAVNPDSSIPLENLGVLALERGDIAAARRHLERAVNVDPRSSRAHADLGVVALKNGYLLAAVAAWLEAVPLTSNHSTSLITIE